MHRNNKVIWSEGMFLLPQHFQQQDRYFEGFIKNWGAPLYPYSWGFSTIEINTALLKQGKIQLTKGSGIFPDGTPFDFPSQNDPPLPLDIDPNLRDEDIVLALPLQGIQTTEIATSESPDNQLARYLEDDINVSDCTTKINNDDTKIKIGRLNIKLMRKRDAADAYTTLGVARIEERRPDNQLILEEDFIPPLLNIVSNRILKEYLQQLCGLLDQRSKHLASANVHPNSRGVAEIDNLLMLQTINRYKLLFLHLNTLPILHPEKLYSVCLNFAGDLAIFDNNNSQQSSFQPAYQHDALKSCFINIVKEIRRLLDIQRDSKATLIQLKKHEKYDLWNAIIHNKELFKTNSFFLAIKTQLKPEDVRIEFPKHIKIGPLKQISDIINRQLYGIPLIPLEHEKRLRTPIPDQPGFIIFEIQQNCSLWKELEPSNELAFFVARIDSFPGLELELWAVEK